MKCGPSHRGKPVQKVKKRKSRYRLANPAEDFARQVIELAHRSGVKPDQASVGCMIAAAAMVVNGAPLGRHCEFAADLADVLMSRAVYLTYDKADADMLTVRH